MKAEQFERIVNALRTCSELLKDPEREKRAARLLVYKTGKQLREDLNDLREAFESNRLFIVDVLDGLELETLDVEALDLDELPELDELPQLEPLDVVLE